MGCHLLQDQSPGMLQSAADAVGGAVEVRARGQWASAARAQGHWEAATALIAAWLSLAATACLLAPALLLAFPIAERKGAGGPGAGVNLCVEGDRKASQKSAADGRCRHRSGAGMLGWRFLMR